MVIIAVVALILGTVCGQWIFPEAWSKWIGEISDYILYLLMFAVGVSVGNNKLVLKKLREYNLTVLLIPFGIVIGSVLSGFVCGLILKMPFSASVPIASGMGWYSLSGVMVGNLSGPEAGAIAFLSNLLREILSFLMIPLVVKYLNPYTAIAPAGATSEDTTLPMMIKYTSEDVVVLSVLNGVFCSALVPVMTNFFHGIL